MRLTESLISNLLLEAYKVLQSLNLLSEQPKIDEIEITKATSYWANITTYRSGSRVVYCKLRVSRVFEKIDDSRVQHDLTETLIHELIHTRPGCNNHGRLFQLAANRVNRSYPQYHIQRCSSVEDRGLYINPSPTHWVVVCKHCGARSEFTKKPKIASYPQNFICSRCCSEGQFQITHIK